MDYFNWIIYGGALFFFVIFAVSYLQDRRKIMNGFLLSVFLCSATISIGVLAVQTQNIFLIGVSILILVLFFLVAAFGSIVLMIGSFINARIVMRKEGRGFSNLLSLFLGLGILMMFILAFLRTRFVFPTWVDVCLSLGYVIIFYFGFIFFNYLLASLLYQFYIPRLNKDYVIILGSGLIDGHIVPPLLAARIEKAISFYRKQEKKRTPPILIFSGGKGDDEHLAESVAMQRYAIEHGIPESATRVEDRSVNTLQNMVYSKELIAKESSGKVRCLFATNTFHLFRAGIYAKQAGLNAQGIGAKTAGYFLPNAIIREFIAIIVMYKKTHLIMVSLLSVLTIFLYFLPQIITMLTK